LHKNILLYIILYAYSSTHTQTQRGGVTAQSYI